MVEVLKDGIGYFIADELVDTYKADGYKVIEEEKPNKQTKKAEVAAE